MAAPDDMQTLPAAFSLGILFQTALGAVLMYMKGHGRTVFQNSRRLVLVLFLITSALWAQVDFINFVASSTNPTTCQATIIISTVCDQLARVAIAGYLLWSVAHVSKSTPERYGLGTLLGLRVVAGTVFTVYTRPQFAPLCIAQSSLLPASISVIGLDVIIIGVLVTRILMLKMVQDIRQTRSSTNKEQSKALVFCTAGFAIWTMMSVIMMLGLPFFFLFLRTALPAIGLQVLIIIVTNYQGALILQREGQAITPEALSPFVPPPPRTVQTCSQIGTPPPHLAYTKRGKLFVVNPSSTPRDSPTLLPGILSADNKGYAKIGGKASSSRQVGDIGLHRLPNEDQDSSGVYRTPLLYPPGIPASKIWPQKPELKSNSISRDVGDSKNAKDLEDGVKREAKQNGHLFGLLKHSAKPNIRDLGISHPIMDETQTTSGTPFVRMRTVDLATAAASERDRRDRVLNEEPTFGRPLPLPPALLKSGKVVRKEAPVRHFAEPPNVNDGSFSKQSTLSTTIDGISTSASLSPGHEEVRRRSPRLLQAFNTEYGSSAGKSPFRMHPSNDYSSKSNLQDDQITATQPQTVMFVNNIVYDNPGVVKSIIDGAPKFLQSDKDIDLESVRTLSVSGSILNRPRPYRRNVEKDRALFPSDPHPHHRRSRSGSSISSRKSIFPTDVGNPTTLPALPSPPPTCAAKLRRLLPNDTRSMTFDEKISLLFPAPPGSCLSHHRTSSVPTIPRIPSTVLARDFMNQIASEEESQSSRSSTGTTIASFRERISHISPIGDEVGDSSEDTYCYSANTYRGLTEIVPQAWSSIPSSVKKLLAVTDNAISADTESLKLEIESENDSEPPWESLHSPAPAMSVTPVQGTAKSLLMPSRKSSLLRNQSLSPCVLATSTEVPISREQEYYPSPDIADKDMGERAYMPDSEAVSVPISLNGEQNSPEIGSQWHNRIGDALPAFSERRKRSKSAAMPPPTPLLLNSTTLQVIIAVRAPTPDSIDSPERALQDIQMQLRKWDGQSQELPCQLPEASPSSANTNEARIGLLQTLEKEMGQQEDEWQKMQRNLHRDSTSPILISPAPMQKAQYLNPLQSEESYRTVPQTTAQTHHIRTSMILRSKGEGSVTTASTQKNSRASLWQQRLAEAHMEYLEYAPELVGNRSLNFLNLTTGGQIGSPTPPESLDSGSDFETDIDSSADEGSFDEFPITLSTMPEKEARPKTLWQPVISTTATQRTSPMWVPPQENLSCRTQSPEPAALSMRLALRKLHHPMQVTSTSLWSMPVTSSNRQAVGLWGSQRLRPKSIVTRPKAQKPQRRSRRVTHLPDIVESPTPLPHSLETLGIFQFPWGEKSGCAILHPQRQSSLSVPSAVNPVLHAASKQSETEIADYSSSFFDDYDEDYEEDSEENSEDDFDESTLWEIANLLNSENVPSRNSLFPTLRIIEDYDDEDSEDELCDTENQPPAKTPIVKFMPILPLVPRSPNPVAQPQEDRDTSAIPETLSTQPKNLGIHTSNNPLTEVETVGSRELSSPVPALVQTSNEESLSRASPYLKHAMSEAEANILPIISLSTTDVQKPASVQSTIVVKQQSTAPPSDTQSRSLWTTAISAVMESTSKSEPTPGASDPEATVPTSTGAAMSWTPQQHELVMEAVGLFQTGIKRHQYRTTERPPAAIDVVHRSRLIPPTLPVLTTQTLWSCKPVTAPNRHWLSSSSIAPSPASDTTASAESTSTSTSSASSPLAEELLASAPSNPTATEISTSSPHKRSNVLASRELWEARATARAATTAKIKPPQ